MEFWISYLKAMVEWEQQQAKRGEWKVEWMDARANRETVTRKTLERTDDESTCNFINFKKISYNFNISWLFELNFNSFLPHFDIVWPVELELPLHFIFIWRECATFGEMRVNLAECNEVWNSSLTPKPAEEKRHKLFAQQHINAREGEAKDSDWVRLKRLDVSENLVTLTCIHFN